MQPWTDELQWRFFAVDYRRTWTFKLTDIINYAYCINLCTTVLFHGEYALHELPLHHFFTRQENYNLQPSKEM